MSTYFVKQKCSISVYNQSFIPNLSRKVFLMFSILYFPFYRSRNVSNPTSSDGLLPNSDDEVDSITLEPSSLELKRPLISSPVNVSPLVKRMKITNVLALNNRQALSTVKFTDTSSQKEKVSSSARSLPSSALGNKLSIPNSRPILNNSSKFVMNSNSISNSNTKSILSNNSRSNSSIFKKTHSFKSSRDIFNHFDR